MLMGSFGFGHHGHGKRGKEHGDAGSDDGLHSPNKKLRRSLSWKAWLFSLLRSD